MTRLLGLTVLLLALCCDSAFAQVTLELTYPPGSKLTSDLALKSHQILTLAGMDLVTKSTTFNIVTKTIGQRGDDGLLAVEEKVDVLQTEVEFPGGIKLVFDSGNPDKKADLPQLEPILERLRAAYKHPVTTILDNTNKIKEIKFPEGVSESVGEANKSLFDAAKRKVAAEQARGHF